MSTVALWTAVDQLIDNARSPHDLRAHGLHLLAVRRWRSLGLDVPRSLVEAERDASFVALSAPLVLAEVRAACAGPILIMKGPELATRYPDPALRPYGDLDLLVEDADAAHAALVASGFTPHRDRDPETFHHLQPLQSPRFPVRVEVHMRPSWLPGMDGPRLEELLDNATAAHIGVEGILAPAAAQHAVLIAVHAWVHEPVGRISQLLDALLLRAECDQADVDATAAGWGAGRVWATTVEAAEGVFFGREVRSTLRAPLRRLKRVEERTVLESHMYRTFSPFWALPLPAATHSVGVRLGRIVRPKPGERWREKLVRIWKAIWHARMGRGRHERRIGFRR